MIINSMNNEEAVITPVNYGLPHDTFRPGQREAIEWVLEQEKTCIVSAATGSGKTSIPRALSQQYRTVALVRTKVLQQDNYEHGYKFSPVYGRNNYACVHADANEGQRADRCLFAESGMKRCVHGQAAIDRLSGNYNDFQPCPYVLAKETAKASQRAVLNYTYWLCTYTTWNKPEILVCDEGHQLSDIVLDWAGTSISDDKRRKWGLPPFPLFSSATAVLNGSKPIVDRAAGWLESSLVHLRSVHAELSAKVQDDEVRKQLAEVETLGQKLRATQEALEQVPQDWYIKSGPVAMNGKPGFIARPLTARYHFGRYFTNDAWHLVIMSATIGDPGVFATELGLKDYSYLEIPSQFTPTQRPVYALDVPGIGQKTNDSGYNKQADEIAKAINDCPGDWSGIVHVSSKREANLLADRLRRRGLNNRIWTPVDGMGTEQMSRTWHEQAKRKPGSINVSWALWEGYDPDPEINLKICITAKTPYPSLADDYEVARQRYDGKMYLQRAAWQLEQGLGRSRRGRLSDYDIDGVRNGLVAIADGHYKRVRKYLTPSLREAIVEGW